MYVPKSHIDALKKKIMDLPTSAGSTRTTEFDLPDAVSGYSDQSAMGTLDSTNQYSAALAAAENAFAESNDEGYVKMLQEAEAEFAGSKASAGSRGKHPNDRGNWMPDGQLSGELLPNNTLGGMLYSVPPKDAPPPVWPTLGRFLQSIGNIFPEEPLGGMRYATPPGAIDTLRENAANREASAPFVGEYHMRNVDFSAGAKQLGELWQSVTDTPPKDNQPGMRYALRDEFIDDARERFSFSVDEVPENIEGWVDLLKKDNWTDSEMEEASAASNVLFEAARIMTPLAAAAKGGRYDRLSEDERKELANMITLSSMLSARAGSGGSLLIGGIDSIMDSMNNLFGLDQNDEIGWNHNDDDYLALALGEDSPLLEEALDFDYSQVAYESNPFLYTAGKLLTDFAIGLGIGKGIGAGTKYIKGFSELPNWQQAVINENIGEVLKSIWPDDGVKSIPQARMHYALPPNTIEKL